MPEKVMYPVDADHYEIEVEEENGEKRFVFTHLFSGITLAHLLAHNKAVINKTVIKKGIETPHFDVQAANALIVDQITQGAFVRPFDADESKNRKLSDDDVRRFTVEAKSKALTRYTQCTVKIETVAEDDIAFMFEDEGEMRALLLVGDEDKPAYEVPIYMKRPSKGKRTQFREGFVKEEKERKKDKVTIKTITDHKTAVAFFKEHFLRAENCLVAGQPYTEDTKDLFLERFNASFMVDVSTALIISFNRSST